MNPIDHIIKVVPAVFLMGLPLTSCIYDDESRPDSQSGNNIVVNTVSVGGPSRAAADGGDNTFMVLFWQRAAHLESPSTRSSAWLAPYLAAHAPQPVEFYKHSVFDTSYPYPLPDDAYIYATGYSPGRALKPDATEGYRILTAQFADSAALSRIDFLGCDVWSEVFRGSLKDPFAQDKNKLYFRHLGAKLIFYANRDEESMENKQFVRNVQITDLQMSIDGGATWTRMYTPSVFEWGLLQDADFTNPYNKVINAVKAEAGNAAALNTRPKAGYNAVEARSFAGAGSDFALRRSDTDRVPIYGMVIDSCYVCNPIDDNGTVRVGKAIRLKMKISAEMSYDHNFPMGDDTSTTDDLTFTRVWKDCIVNTISQVTVGADGKEQILSGSVDEFTPGCEYRIYINFNRTGVNLVAKELPWGSGGVHYITISGGNQHNQQPDKQ